MLYLCRIACAVHNGWRWRFCDLNKLIKIQTGETVAVLKKHPKYTAETVYHTHTHTLTKWFSSLSLQLSSFFCLLHFDIQLLSLSPVTVCLLISLSLHITSALDSFHHLSPPRSHSSSRYLEYAAQPFLLRHFRFPCLPLCPLLLLLPLLLPLSAAALSHQFICTCMFLLSSSWPLSHLLSRSSKCNLLSLCVGLTGPRDSNPHSCH